jgi:hypothetical protein
MHLSDFLPLKKHVGIKLTKVTKNEFCWH